MGMYMKRQRQLDDYVIDTRIFRASVIAGLTFWS